MAGDLVRKIRRKRRIGFNQTTVSKPKISKNALQEWVTNIKKQPCMDCKQRFHPAAMDFDHLPRYKKSFSISEFIRNNSDVPNARQLVEDEINKCQLVCANCHRIRTWWRSKRKGF